METGELTTSIVETTKSGIDAVTSLSTDILAGVALFAILAFYGIKWGKRRLSSLILSLYLAIPAYNAFPYFSKITEQAGEQQPFVVPIAVYLGFALVIHFVLMQFMTTVEPSESHARKWFEVLLLSLLSVLFLFAVAFNILGLESSYDFSSQISKLFEPTTYFFWWFLAPLVGLFFLSRRRG
jgi:uncharacterized membrane protein YidH (DUF202 family)